MLTTIYVKTKPDGAIFQQQCAYQDYIARMKAQKKAFYKVHDIPEDKYIPLDPKQLCLDTENPVIQEKYGSILLKSRTGLIRSNSILNKEWVTFNKEITRILPPDLSWDYVKFRGRLRVSGFMSEEEKRLYYRLETEDFLGFRDVPVEEEYLEEITETLYEKAHIHAKETSEKKEHKNEFI